MKFRIRPFSRRLTQLSMNSVCGTLQEISANWSFERSENLHNSTILLRQKDEILRPVCNRLDHYSRGLTSPHTIGILVVLPIHLRGSFCRSQRILEQHQRFTFSSAMPYNNSSTDSFASSAPSSTSVSLLKRVKDQNPEAWRRLVRLYGPVVFLWCRQAGLTVHDAADVIQDVWMAVARSIADFRRDRPNDSFRGWLRRITQYKIIDRWRKREPSAMGGLMPANARASP